MVFPVPHFPEVFLVLDYGHEDQRFFFEFGGRLDVHEIHEYISTPSCHKYQFLPFLSQQLI